MTLRASQRLLSPFENRFRCPDKPSFESTVDVCIVCSVFAFTRAHRRREVQKVYQTASTGRQQSRKAVGRTTPDDKARPSLFGTTILPCLDISDSQATKHHLDRTKRVMNKDAILNLGCSTLVHSPRRNNWLAKLLSHYTAQGG
jgi:hypothetical protein